MRAPDFHRHLLRIAFAAALLLLLVPTVGRVMRASAQADGAWAQMCTLAGMKLVRLPGTDIDPAPVPPSHMPDDCAYCPLLQALAVLVLWLAVVHPQGLARFVPARDPPLRWRSHPTGLGSRGPPLAP